MRDYITTSEAAASLGISRQRIDQFIRDGRLAAESFGVGGGKLLLVRAIDVRRLILRPTGRPKSKKPLKTRAKQGRKIL